MLGNRIAYLRGQLGWSQAELAHRLNLSPSAVGMYEQGRREPSADMLVSISRTLGVSVEFLLTGNKDTIAPCQKAIGQNGAYTLVESLKMLSRDELLVLLTASLLSGSADDRGEKSIV